jgi:hypothetical protein
MGIQEREEETFQFIIRVGRPFGVKTLLHRLSDIEAVPAGVFYIVPGVETQIHEVSVFPKTVLSIGLTYGVVNIPFSVLTF